MNFQFNLNETFPGGSHSVIKIGHDLLPDDFNTFTSNGRNFHQIQHLLYWVPLNPRSKFLCMEPHSVAKVEVSFNSLL